MHRWITHTWGRCLEQRVTRWSLFPALVRPSRGMCHPKQGTPVARLCFGGQMGVTSPGEGHSNPGSCPPASLLHSEVQGKAGLMVKAVMARLQELVARGWG